jgi:hypothetical protein
MRLGGAHLGACRPVVRMPSFKQLAFKDRSDINGRGSCLWARGRYLNFIMAVVLTPRLTRARPIKRGFHKLQRATSILPWVAIQMPQQPPIRGGFKAYL